MAITEKTRHELYQRLEQVLGPNEATTFMELLPPVGWADVATKDDLHQLEARVGSRIDGLDARLGARIDTLDGRIDSLDARLSGRIDRLETSVNARIDVLGSDLRAEMANLSAEVHSTLRTNAYLTIGAMAALVTLISAVSTLV